MVTEYVDIEDVRKAQISYPYLRDRALGAAIDICKYGVSGKLNADHIVAEAKIIERYLLEEQDEHQS